MKVGIKSIKKIHTEEKLKVKNLGKPKDITGVNNTNRIQEMEEEILGIEDKIEEIDTLIKENTKNKSRHKNIQEIWDIM